MKRPVLNLGRRGFTLIEMVVVFALGGLVIAIVFLLVHTAQVSGRNDLRQVYLHKVAANVEVFKESAANNFVYPPDQATFASKFSNPGPYYIAGNDPLSGNAYTFGGLAPPSGSTSAGISYSPPPATPCNGGALVAGIYTLTISLEGGSTYCIDNH